MPSFCLDVRGDFACFTRPEMKVERVSYDVITPSSVRAIFESVLWKPAMRWMPERIEVLAPIRWTSIRRNEVGSKVSVASVSAASRGGKGSLALYVDEDRQQRAGLFLRDVRYRIHAGLELTAHATEEDTLIKFVEMFGRRAEKGQCINQPYLGCREFACEFALHHATQNDVAPISESRGLGWMLYDMDFGNLQDPQPRFFNANMQAGVIQIPEWDSAEVRG
jgi:CRISPR-associated protein Cas5d